MFNKKSLHWLTALLCGVAVSGFTFVDARPAVAQAPAPAAAEQPAHVGLLEITGPLREGPPPVAMGQWKGDLGEVRSLTSKLHYVADQPGYLGAVIYLEQPILTRGQMYELQAAMQRVRDAGKKVVVQAESYDLATYALACSADHILLQRGGAVELGGLGVEEIYVAGLLGKIGAKVDLHQVGDFKGAQDPFVRNEPSEQWSQTMDQLLDDLYGQVVQRISEGRNLTPEQVEELMARSLAMSGEQLVEAGLIDALVDAGSAVAAEQLFDRSFAWDAQLGEIAQQPPQNPFALFQMLVSPPPQRAPRPGIAVLYASGPIMSGQSNAPGIFGGMGSIGSQTIVEELAKANSDPSIKGVLIRLDSPGGSALASEVIWQAVREVRKNKPVYISLGDIAASGGYYIAAAGDRVYAGPETLVGSIGVVGGKVVLGEMYDSLGVKVYRRSRGPLGDMFNSVSPFTDDQRQLLELSMQKTYDQFVNRVKAGRDGRLNAPVEDVAQGRIFTGRRAAELGMIDEIGDMQSALDDLVAAANLQPNGYDLVPLPAPLSLPEYLDRILGGKGAAMGGAASPLATQQAFWQMAEQALGPQAWRPTSRLVIGLSLLQNEPVLTLLPAAIVVK